MEGLKKVWKQQREHACEENANSFSWCKLSRERWQLIGGHDLEGNKMGRHYSHVNIIREHLDETSVGSRRHNRKYIEDRLQNIFIAIYLIPPATYTLLIIMMFRLISSYIKLSFCGNARVLC